MMHGFEFYTPTRVIFGAGSLEKLPEAVGRCGAKRVFVIYGGQSAKKRGASLITEKNLYVIGQEEKRQGYNAGIDK